MAGWWSQIIVMVGRVRESAREFSSHVSKGQVEKWLEEMKGMECSEWAY